MRDFLAEHKEALEKNEGKPVKVNVTGGKDEGGDYSNCLLKMKCDLFQGEEIGIIYGTGKFKPNKTNPGGRLRFPNDSEVNFSGVMFTLKELKYLFETWDESVAKLAYEAKKKFGSRARIIGSEMPEDHGQN